MGSIKPTEDNQDLLLKMYHQLSELMSYLDNIVTAFLQSRHQLTNHELFINFRESSEKINDKLSQPLGKDRKENVRIAISLALEFAILYTQLIQIQLFIKQIEIVEVRESILIDSTSQSIEKALFKLIEFENHNILSQFGYDKYSNELIAQTKADIDRIMKLRDQHLENEESEEGTIYLFKNGKRIMSDYEFLEHTGLDKTFKAKGISFPPLHNAEILKASRLERFEQAKIKLIEERRIDQVETSELDLNIIYCMWLKSELLKIEQWTSNTFPNGDKKPIGLSNSNRIEVFKYKTFINTEIELTEQRINPQSQKIVWKGNSEKIIESLNEFSFTNYLQSHNYNELHIQELINSHSGKELVPYTLALLNEIGYLTFFFNEFTTTKLEGYKKLAEIFDSSERRIKGNVLVLNPKSIEDTTQYTSYTYSEMIRKELEGR